MSSCNKKINITVITVEVYYSKGSFNISVAIITLIYVKNDSMIFCIQFLCVDRNYCSLFLFLCTLLTLKVDKKKSIFENNTFFPRKLEHG